MDLMFNEAFDEAFDEALDDGGEEFYERPEDRDVYSDLAELDWDTGESESDWGECQCEVCKSRRRETEEDDWLEESDWLEEGDWLEEAWEVCDMSDVSDMSDMGNEDRLDDADDALDNIAVKIAYDEDHPFWCGGVEFDTDYLNDVDVAFPLIYALSSVLAAGLEANADDIAQDIMKFVMSEIVLKY